jgi:signal peptidase I
VTAPTILTPAHRAKRRLSTGAIVGIVCGCVTLVLVVAVVVVALAVFGTNTMRLTATGVGMEPTIRVHQTVSATKVDSGKYQPKRGDIVVFKVPTRWLANASDQMQAKRVIGLPGEHMSCCDPKGQWLVEGKPLAEPYVKSPSTSASTPMDVLVPDGRLWIMGDNRGSSNDSRTMFSMTRDIGTATISVSAVVAVVKL